MASFGRKWQILLQKSATVMTGRLPGFWGTSCYFAPFGERGIREAHQLVGLRICVGHARHASTAGGGRAVSFANRRRFCGDSAERIPARETGAIRATR